MYKLLYSLGDREMNMNDIIKSNRTNKQTNKQIDVQRYLSIHP